MFEAPPPCKKEKDIWPVRLDKVHMNINVLSSLQQKKLGDEDCSKERLVRLLLEKED